jgi:two-component system, response regulator
MKFIYAFSTKDISNKFDYLQKQDYIYVSVSPNFLRAKKTRITSNFFFFLTSRSYFVDVKKILLIDDSSNDVELTRRALKKSQIYNELVVISDGADAVKFFFDDADNCVSSANELPLVVLLDLNLPRVSGIEILHKLRACESTKLMPVIILTGSTEEKDRIAVDKLGFVSFVTKPIKFPEFTEAIRLLRLYLVLIDEKSIQHQKD